MKYYIDTEFLEGTQKKTLLGIPYGNTKPTIDLISIGIIAEDGREYYAISKDFNLKEAWNKYQLEQVSGDGRNIYPEGKPVYWIRENVLKPIYKDLVDIELKDFNSPYYKALYTRKENSLQLTYNNFKRLIRKYGKTNKEIAKEIKEFVGTEETISNWNEIKDKMNTQFYGYYADYDWVVFCWLFGKMIDLPKGFPMYCIDLKQELDNKQLSYDKSRMGFKIEDIESYPKQTNEHNALADAKWNKKLHEFILKL